MRNFFKNSGWWLIAIVMYVALVSAHGLIFSMIKSITWREGVQTWKPLWGVYVLTATLAAEHLRRKYGKK